MILRFAASVILLAGAACCAKADTYTYTYTGNDFTQVSGSYTTSDHVTISFTVNAPLADSMTTSLAAMPGPATVPYTISDGLFSFSSGGFFGGFSVTTNGTGAITDWFIVDEQNTYNYIASNPALDDGDMTNPSGMAVEQGQVSGNPGTWVETTNVVAAPGAPEPSSLYLLGTGAMGLLGLRHRRRVSMDRAS